jgi:hypothetical protein
MEHFRVALVLVELLELILQPQIMVALAELMVAALAAQKQVVLGVLAVLVVKEQFVLSGALVDYAALHLSLQLMWGFK